MSPRVIPFRVLDRASVEEPTARAFTRWLAGRLADAEADARHALAAANSGQFESIRRIATAVLVNVLTERGDLAVARAIADTPPSSVDPFAEAMLQTALGRLALATGQPDAALETLAPAGTLLETGDSYIADATPWRELSALALLELDRREDATEMLAPALDFARRHGTPHGLGTALRVAALITQPADITLLEEALAMLARAQAGLERARALIDLGSALRRARHRKQALAPLEHGRLLAISCSATPLVQHADDELTVLRTAPRRHLADGHEALTASERRVARLAIDGLSNPEIAQALCVSRKAVEKHLSNCYLKLNINSRRELTADSAPPRSFTIRQDDVLG